MFARLRTWFRHHRAVAGFHTLWRTHPLLTVGALLVVGFVLWGKLSAKPAPRAQEAKPAKEVTSVVRHAVQQHDDLKEQQRDARLVVDLQAQVATEKQAREKLDQKLERLVQQQEKDATERQALTQQLTARTTQQADDRKKEAEARKKEAEERHRREVAERKKEAEERTRQTRTTAQPAGKAAAVHGPVAELRMLKSDGKDTVLGPPPPNNWRETAHILSTCYGEGVVVTGFMGSSRAGSKLPTTVSITKPLYCPHQLQGPGRNPAPTYIPIQGCMVQGEGVGDPASSRGYVHLRTLACVLPDRSSMETEVKGYLTGFDGTYGVPGETYRPGSAAELKALLTAVLQEASAALSVARSQLVVTSGLQGAQPFSGVQTGLQQLTQLYIQQIQFLLPVIWVKSQTKVYVVFEEGLNMPGLPLHIQVARGTP